LFFVYYLFFIDDDFGIILQYTDGTFCYMMFDFVPIVLCIKI